MCFDGYIWTGRAPPVPGGPEALQSETSDCQHVHRKGVGQDVAELRPQFNSAGSQ
jgi:hypothetical protein